MIESLEEYKARRDGIFDFFDDRQDRNAALKKLDADTDPLVLAEYEEEVRRKQEWKEISSYYSNEWNQDDGRYTDDD